MKINGYVLYNGTDFANGSGFKFKFPTIFENQVNAQRALSALKRHIASGRSHESRYQSMYYSKNEIIDIMNSYIVTEVEIKINED